MTQIEIKKKSFQDSIETQDIIHSWGDFFEVSSPNKKLEILEWNKLKACAPIYEMEKSDNAGINV